jgi:dephospho-CoA kinase
MLKAGLTGSIAVGKTFVVSVFRELGCVTFDADQITHRDSYNDIVREFGREVLGEDGLIDRKKLGAIVFRDSGKRQRLNELVHPRVILEQNRLLAEAEQANPDGIAIIDAALMIESGGYKRFDRLIVVFCDREEQIERLMKRNGLSREEADVRVAAQMSSEEKRRYADYEIDTSGSHEETRARVIAVHKQLQELRSARVNHN